jgi:hypothetical protein
MPGDRDGEQGAEQAGQFPLLATMTPAGTAPQRACGHCTAAKNVTGTVIIRGRPATTYASGTSSGCAASTAPAWPPCPTSPAASAATTGTPRTSLTRTSHAPTGRPRTSPASGSPPDGIPRSPNSGTTGTAAWPPRSRARSGVPHRHSGTRRASPRLEVEHPPADAASSPLDPPTDQFTDRIRNPRGQPHAYHRRHACPALVLSLHVRPRERGLGAAAQ